MDKKKIIRQDNKEYEFTPGKEGSLIVRGEPTKPTFDVEPLNQAKSILAPGLSELAMYLDPNRKLKGISPWQSNQ